MVNMQDLINQIAKNMQAAAKKYKIIQPLKEHEFVLDEDLVRFCGRCLFIQRIDRKPARKGLLFRVLAECETRYILNTELFYGKAQENRSNILEYKDTALMTMVYTSNEDKGAKLVSYNNKKDKKFNKPSIIKRYGDNFNAVDIGNH